MTRTETNLLLSGATIASVFAGLFFWWATPHIEERQLKERAVEERCTDAGGVRLYFRSEGYVCFDKKAILL